MLKKVIKFLLDFLFPKNCLICQEGEEYLCQKCFRNLKFKDPHCPSCDNTSKIGAFCNKCQDKFELKGVLVAGDFNDKNLATLIKYYKYNFIKELGACLGLFLVNFLNNNIGANPILKIPSSNFNSDSRLNSISNSNINSDIRLNSRSSLNLNSALIPGHHLKLNLNTKPKSSLGLNLNLKNYLLIPAPLSKKRIRWRGFNQSQVLVEKINREMGLKFSLDLIRIKHRTAQAKLNKKEREKNLANCFKWTGENLRGQKIIIVDDVYTTGSTLNEIAKELKKHQTGEIWGLVLAKS